jgi:geranylgeranyl diphosphate synthase type I
MRRGEEALHLVHGTDIALNAGNAMYFLPLKVITRNPGDLGPDTRLAAYEMLMHELNRTHLGQGVDIRWHNEQWIRVTESQYLEMCACKTGCLGRIVARLAAIVTGQDRETEEHVAQYAQQMSIAFQIGDDILDIEHTLDQAADIGDVDADAETGDFGKEFGNDIREGKKTLMVIHAAEKAPPEDVARLEAILWADENTTEEILEAIEILQETDAIEYARERALDLAASAREQLDAVDLEPEPAENLAEFTRFVVEHDV